ncbi:SGNH/GDSL hydrolase family protein [Bacillus songklensis]|uniref:SGNH/GDSL hydrolase family protein n=1 Tax=Bacillus songklensis TaxID=1069116 RepID=A0ABV8B825_9BACI
MGDSIAAGWGGTHNFGYVQYLCHFLEELFGRVFLSNRAVPGMTSKTLLWQLRFDSETRAAVF